MANKRLPFALFLVLLGLSSNLAAGKILFQVSFSVVHHTSVANNGFY